MGVLAGESLLDDMEGCGDELVLSRACALGGGCPNERVEIIRPDAGANSKTKGSRGTTLDSEGPRSEAEGGSRDGRFHELRPALSL